MNKSILYIIIVQYKKMYIKTYVNKIDPQPQKYDTSIKNTRNLAKNTPQGINLHKIILRRSLSKSQSCSPTKNQKQITNIKIQPFVYQSNCFGISLKNNRLRQMKTKSKVTQKLHHKVKDQLMNIIQQNVNKNNNTTMYTPRKNSYRRNSSINFAIAGRPANKNCKSSYLKQKSLSVENTMLQNVANQTVLDFTKIKNNNKLSQGPLTKYTKFNFQRLRKGQANIQQNKEQYYANQPQILIDYRRVMSSGRKRSKIINQPIKTDTEQLNKKYEVNIHGQKINAWAVRNFDEDQQLIF